jgi:hypothetical protein
MRQASHGFGPREKPPLALSSFSRAAGSAISARLLRGIKMRRFFLIAAGLLAFTQGAGASANVDCEAADNNVPKLLIEAITSRDGKYLASLRGELELEAGKTIELSASDVKSHKLEKNIALLLVKRTPQGPVEIRIFAKQKDEIDLEGTYLVTAGKVKKGGKVKCSAG